MSEWYEEGGALNIKTSDELLRFDLGSVVIGHTTYTILTGYEGAGKCSWCGGELKGKLKRYCRGHMTEYYRHFAWGYASRWALRRAGGKCENCGCEKGEQKWGWGAFRTNLEVHHIIPVNGRTRQFTAYNLPFNLIVLCHDCHVEVHALMRPPKMTNGTPDNWEEAKKIGQSIMELAHSSPIRQLD